MANKRFTYDPISEQFGTEYPVPPAPHKCPECSKFPWRADSLPRPGQILFRCSTCHTERRAWIEAEDYGSTRHVASKLDAPKEVQARLGIEPIYIKGKGVGNHNS